MSFHDAVRPHIPIQNVSPRVSRCAPLCGPPKDRVAPVPLREGKTRCWPPCAPLWTGVEKPSEAGAHRAMKPAPANLSLFRPVFRAMQTFDFCAG